MNYKKIKILSIISIVFILLFAVAVPIMNAVLSALTGQMWFLLLDIFAYAAIVPFYYIINIWFHAWVQKELYETL